MTVSSTPDGYYDLIYYESALGATIQLDQIIIGIANDILGSNYYYEIFNWGNNVRDQNTNVDYATLPAAACTQECDNRVIPTSVLYPGSGPYSTGILIDVDTAPGAPPPGTYNYLVIISPEGGSWDPAQVDAVVVTEVGGGPMGSMPVASKDVALNLPVEDAVPIPPVDNAQAPPADIVPDPPVDNVQAPTR